MPECILTGRANAVIGVNDHLEIWDEDAFNSYLDDNASSLADIAENSFDEKDAL